MDEYTPKMKRADASLFRNTQSALNVLSMVKQTQTIKNVREVLQAGIDEVKEAYMEADEQITHAQLQQHASVALRQAMKEGIAYEVRQVREVLEAGIGDIIEFTTVMDKDVRGTVLAVAYPDGGIDYYPTEVKDRQYAGKAFAPVTK